MIDIAVTLTDDEKTLLVQSYVNQRLLPESQSVFEDGLATKEIQQALYDAVVNDAAVLALMDQMRIEEENARTE